MRIRTLLADDEPLARAGLRELLHVHDDIDIVGDCGDGQEALERIEALEPDLVFLDIQMPALGGFEVLEQLQGAAPVIVFVTAYSEHALRAFQVNAVDYLLKPIDPAALAGALARTRDRLAARRSHQWSPDDDLEHALRNHNEVAGNGASPHYLPRIFVREGERGFFVRTSDLEWVQTAGNYLRISAGGREHLIRATMYELEQKLDPYQFARIHRRTIVNLERVDEIATNFRGHHIVRMKDGSEHRLSRTFRERLLGRPL
ncbi:MAG TPA: LytTR family DNA-binding domain-containing protein [Longimicrobiales bacterium]|nr:LytTR family DNA-binding domain-containing protein [Longimicrobiales bacterium]